MGWHDSAPPATALGKELHFPKGRCVKGRGLVVFYIDKNSTLRAALSLWGECAWMTIVLCFEKQKNIVITTHRLWLVFQRKVIAGEYREGGHHEGRTAPSADRSQFTPSGHEKRHVTVCVIFILTRADYSNYGRMKTYTQNRAFVLIQCRRTFNTFFFWRDTPKISSR